MVVEIITKDDLREFRMQLLNDIKQLLVIPVPDSKPWLKSQEVRKLLKISAGTLQKLRINGTLQYTKVGAILYYRYEDIVKVLENNMTE